MGLKLFLPREWTDDVTRMDEAGVPEREDVCTYPTKMEIALREIDRVRAVGVVFGTMLADAGYGMSAEFRHALSARDLTWAVGISRIQRVYPADVGCRLRALGECRLPTAVAVAGAGRGRDESRRD